MGCAGCCWLAAGVPAAPLLLQREHCGVLMCDITCKDVVVANSATCWINHEHLCCAEATTNGMLGARPSLTVDASRGVSARATHWSFNGHARGRGSQCRRCLLPAQVPQHSPTVLAVGHSGVTYAVVAGLLFCGRLLGVTPPVASHLRHGRHAGRAVSAF